MNSTMTPSLTTGRRPVPEHLERAGYRFRPPDLEDALRAVLSRRT